MCLTQIQKIVFRNRKIRTLGVWQALHEHEDWTAAMRCLIFSNLKSLFCA